MADEIGGLQIRIGLDGADFQQGIQGINREMKVLESAFKLQGAGISNFGTSLDGLRAKATMLNGQIELQRDKLARLREALQRSTDATGANSRNSQNLQIQVNNLARGLVTLETNLTSTNRSIALQSSHWTTLSTRMRATSTALKPIGEGFKDVGSKLSLGLTAPILAAGGAMFKLASDMNETINKVDVAFKSNATEVKEWGNTALTQFGISKGAALDAAALFGDMGTAMGQSTQEASKMSTNLVGLAGDLSSFKNIGLAQAQDALKGIFTGEGESLKGLGIIMQDSTLKAYALATGQTKTYTEMTQAEKVALRYAYVMSTTKNAQGDFARTADGSANQMRIFQESIKQLAAQIGQNLIPVITPLIAKLNEWADKFSKLSPETQKTILIIGGIAAAIGPVLVVIGTLCTAVSAITAAFATASAGIAAAGGIIAVLTGPIAIAIAVVVGLIAVGVLLYKNWDTVKLKVGELGTALKNTWTGIKTSVTNIFTGIGTFFTNLWAGITTTTQNVWNGIKTFFSDIWNGIVTVVMAIVTPFITGITNIWGSMKDGISITMNGIKTFLGGIWEVIKLVVLGPVLLIFDIVTGNFGKLSTDSQGIFNKFKEALSKIWTGIKLIFTGVLKAIGDFLKLEWDSIVKIATTAWTSFSTWITGFWNKIIQSAKDIWNGLITWFKELPKKLYDIAVNMFTFMKNGVVNTVTSVKDAIIKGITVAIDWIRKLPAEMLQLGIDMIQGLINGITGMIAKVQNVVSDLAKGISNKIRGALGIKSPSKVMMEIGGYTGEGLALGLDNSKSKVFNTMKELSSGMIGSMGSPSRPSGVSSFGVNITVNGNIVGTNGMKELADIISNKISGRVGLSMGGAY